MGRKKKRGVKPPETGRTFWFWQGLSLGTYVLFVWLLYLREKSLIAAMAVDGAAPLADSVRKQLSGLTLWLLPGDAWYLPLPLFLVAAGLLFFRRWRWYFLALSGAAASLVLLGDRVYYDFFSAILSVDSLKVSGQLWDVRHSVLAAVGWRDGLWVAVFLFFAGFGYLRLRFGEPALPGLRIMVADKLLGTAVLALALHCGWVAFRLPNQAVAMKTGTSPGKANRTASFFSLENLNQNEFATYFGLFNFHLNDAWLSLKTSVRDEKITTEEWKATSYLLEEKKALNDRPSPLFGMARGRNVLLVSLESFQHFLLDLSIGGREITPTMNRLKRDAFYWDYILDNVGRGGTSDSEFMVMTGLMPDPRQMASMSIPAKNKLLALPATLKDAGYRTYSFHGHVPSFWNRHINHPIYGIEKMVFEEAYRFDKRLGLGVPDTEFFQQTWDYLEGLPKPFFAFLISLSSHHPYQQVPESHRDMETPFEPDSMIAKYLQLANYTDRAMGDFIERMAASPLWTESLIVLYGDHISPLDSKNRRSVQSELGFDTKSFREFRIPFLILVPGREALIHEHRERYSQVVGGLQDLFPTVLHLLGHETPFGIFGTNLFVSNEERGTQPYFRVPQSFIDTGILYLKQGRITDRNGLVFSGDVDQPKLSGTQIEQNLLKAQAQMALHRLIFDRDAQIKLVRARQDR